ncbi:hypothetical protein FB565_000012 [Actinoplanes lutulentus]|uniref:Uncharacterized protein n=1 Tax=Actinoplanes lutulentus TaxID=1287878 RepID=A0A327Z3M9_9ACTN|nr:hypothetical protein [Actinoplanes lutulentus]MBB2940308.1 hypothetical protein [Actinoplanes lutulentus]RAK28801.1 hypothetical protein B0I29_119139 [Actinoplanes lutulentus]
MTTNQDAASHGPPVTPESVPRVVASLCGSGTCPTVYRTDDDTDHVLVQGYAATGVAVPKGELLVKIPRELLLEAARRIQEQDA